MGIKRIVDNLEGIAGKFIHMLCGFLFLVMAAASLLCTRYFVEDYSAEIPYNRVEAFPVTLLGMVFLGVIIIWLGRKVAGSPIHGEKNLRILLVMVMIWTFVIGCVWIKLSESCPVADQGMVFSSAERFLQGNYGRLDYGKYLYYYPMQLGLVAYEELMICLFGEGNYTVLQIMNAAGISVSVLAGYCITRYLSEKKEIAAYYLLLMGSCLVYIVYGAYVYGDVFSITFSLIAIWQLLRYMKKGKKSSVFFMALGICAAVLVRSNSLIVFIAIASVLLVKGIVEKRWQYLICILLLVAGVFGEKALLNQYYELKSGIQINEGMPSVLWVAMGMQEGEKEAGWYNGYSVYVYQDVCQYDEETASDLGWGEIRSRAKTFLKDPAYALDFYWRKFTSQWNEPTYGCFIMTYATEEERSALGESLYTGKLNHMLKAFMNVYQLLVYCSVFCFLVRTRKKKYPLEFYTLLIAVIGGVLFHLLWEAKSRYVLPYFVFMLPMAAAGLYEMKEMLLHGRAKDEAAEAGR